MTRHLRFTTDPGLPVTAPDGVPGVLRGTLEGALVRAENGQPFALDQIRLLPCVSPSKIICVGRNYAEHARELGNDVPSQPLLFLKPPSSLNAHGAPVVYPKLSQVVSFEGELGLVIGRRGRHIRAAEAFDYIAGYTIVNDFTARDLQKQDGQWTRGKGFDTFCPVGPWWVSRDELPFEGLRVTTRVNGERRQDAPVSDMLFGPGAILEFVSAFLTLEPGDLIATGTPPGVGPVHPGDVVAVEVPGLGVLESPLIAE